MTSFGGDDDDESRKPGFDDDAEGDDEHEIAMAQDAAAMEMEEQDGMEGGEMDLDDMMDVDAMDIEMGFDDFGGDGNI